MSDQLGRPTSRAGAATFTAADDALADRYAERTFRYFSKNVNATNGLTADTTRPGSPASIAVAGFALSAYTVGVDKGWISRTDAVACTLRTLRWFMQSDQSGSSDATGYKGFYFHFLDMSTGRRMWNCELSVIDTALLLAGMLTSRVYFSGNDAEETSLRGLVDALYARVDWRWAVTKSGTLSHGWKPESDFLRYEWQGYDEALIAYVLALGSPTFPIDATSYGAWCSTYDWAHIDDHDLLFGGPLFVHQYSHAWIDFEGIRDAFMREKQSDYFDNSRCAIEIHRAYAERNPKGFKGYGPDMWGLSACDGPGRFVRTRDDRKRRFWGYLARGAPYGPDDGTIAPAAMIASLPFSPELVLPSWHALDARIPQVLSEGGIASAINETFAKAGEAPWLSESCFGLDQGIALLMIENHRSRFVWELMRKCEPIRIGLERAGFNGGWLDASAAGL